MAMEELQGPEASGWLARDGYMLMGDYIVLIVATGPVLQVHLTVGV